MQLKGQPPAQSMPSRSGTARQLSMQAPKPPTNWLPNASHNHPRQTSNQSQAETAAAPHMSRSNTQQSSRRRFSESAPPTSSSLEGPTATMEARSRGQGAGCSGESPDSRLHSQVSVSCKEWTSKCALSGLLQATSRRLHSQVVSAADTWQVSVPGSRFLLPVVGTSSLRAQQLLLAESRLARPHAHQAPHVVELVQLVLGLQVHVPAKHVPGRDGMGTANICGQRKSRVM